MDFENKKQVDQPSTPSRVRQNVQNLLKLCGLGNCPRFLFSCLVPLLERAYHDAYKKEFWTMKKKTRTEHIDAIKLSGNMNNNEMERFNGEIRDREKTMRGIKKSDTPILNGYQIFHNYIRGHEGLEGKTPSEACGIDVKGKNKWLTLIQNASQNKPQQILNRISPNMAEQVR